MEFRRLDGHRVFTPRALIQRYNRDDAVALVLSTGVGLAQAGRDLGVNPETLRKWVKAGQNRQVVLFSQPAAPALMDPDQVRGSLPGPDDQCRVSVQTGKLRTFGQMIAPFGPIRDIVTLQRSFRCQHLEETPAKADLASERSRLADLITGSAACCTTF